MALGLVIGATRFARAEDPLLGTIEVRAAKDATPTVRDESAFATVVPIADQPAEIDTLADVLDETVGVQVRRYGGLGDFATVSIRGSTPGQVGVFFDGVALTRARSETINLADLPLDQLGRVEIYRGVSPLDLSSSALAGAINLVSRAPDAVPRFSLLAGGGSFGTRKVSMAGSAARGALAALVSATYLGTEGDFEFEDDNGTLQNPGDDRRTTRKNNAFDSGEALAKLVGHGLQQLVAEERAVALVDGAEALDIEQQEALRTFTFESFLQLAFGLPAVSEAGEAVDSRFSARGLDAFLEGGHLGFEPVRGLFALAPHFLGGLPEAGDVVAETAAQFPDVLDAGKFFEAVGQFVEVGFVTLAVALETADGAGHGGDDILNHGVAFFERRTVGATDVVDLLDCNPAGLVDGGYGGFRSQGRGRLVQGLSAPRGELGAGRKGGLREGAEQRNEGFKQGPGADFRSLRFLHLFTDRDHSRLLPVTFITNGNRRILAPTRFTKDSSRGPHP